MSAPGWQDDNAEDVAPPEVVWDDAWDDDVAEGLTPRAWLESDPVPLTPDIDLSDTAQRLAWIRANNAMRSAREVELRKRRAELIRTRGRGGRTARRGDGAGTQSSSRAVGRRSSTTVVGIRMLHEERDLLDRVARREGVTVSDLVRRWVRRGIDGVEVSEEDPGLDRGR